MSINDKLREYSDICLTMGLAAGATVIVLIAEEAVSGLVSANLVRIIEFVCFAALAIFSSLFALLPGNHWLGVRIRIEERIFVL